MNGKKGSIEINIPSITKANRLPDEMGKNAGGSGFSSKGWIRRVWEFGKEDSNRVTFSFKVGLAVLLVSLLVLFRAPYEVFGTNIIWSILTVAIMFECTVGATFNRGFNRALGSLMAGVLAIGVAQVALCSGHVAQPFIIGISIFLVGAVTSFMKQWPSLVPYEHGFRVVLFTYCLIVVSGYRMGNPIRTSIGRLYSIAIGGIVAILVNVLVFPIWAGEQLHEELVKSFDAVADSLEECVKKYLEDDGADHLEFSKTVREEFPNEPAYKKCQSTLNSSSKLESLANLAKWEPPHGRFRHFCYPWLEYVKVGAVLRHCAYEVMALHGVLHSEIQAPFNLRITFQREIQDATTQAANLVRSLGKDVSNMKRSLRTSLLKRVHSSAEQLRCAIDMHSYLLTYTYEPPPLSDNSSKPLPKLSPSLSPVAEDPTTTVTADQNPSSPPQEAAAVAETYHGMMRKQSRRLHSWPSREVDAFEEERGFSVDFIPRMKVVESTAALSLTTFASLLIEFVARLDHLVEAVEELARLAKFRHELQ